LSATFQFSESNGAGQTIYDGIGNINFGSVDAHDLVPSSNPITFGQNSFSKYIRGKFTGTWTTISNMKFWKSLGGYATGELIVAGFNVSYATPSQTATGDSAVPTSEPSQNVNSFEGASTIVHGASGVSGYTGYIRLQEQTTVSTPAGAVATKTFVMQYDEV
jgi:hypothetical protein